MTIIKRLTKSRTGYVSTFRRALDDLVDDRLFPTAHGRREFFRRSSQKSSSGDPQLASWGRLYKKVIKVLFNKRAGVFLDLIKHATCEFI